MDTSEIIRILGPSTVETVEKAVAAAFTAAEQHHDAAEGAAAVNALLVLMMASAIITPAAGAAARARIVSDQIVELVEEALSLSSAPSIVHET
jgi:hypothetical protein